MAQDKYVSFYSGTVKNKVPGSKNDPGTFDSKCKISPSYDGRQHNDVRWDWWDLP